MFNQLFVCRFAETKQIIMRNDLMETIYIGSCECLDCGDITSSDCLKRYLIVFDYDNFVEVKMVICNQYLRLKLHQRANIKRGYISGDGKIDSYVTRIVLEEIVSKALNTDNIGYSHRNPRFEYDVIFSVCQRPFITRHENIFLMTEKLLNQEYKYSSFIMDLEHSYFAKLKEMCNHYLKYAKYKKTHNDCKRLLKKFTHIFSLKYNQEELVELFNLILTLKTNQ